MKNYYEIMYIIDPVKSDEEFDETIKKYTSLLEENGAEIDETDIWGNKKFEYEIDGKNSGYYVVVYFEAPGDLIQKLDREMRIDDDILRWQTLKYDAKMLRHREQQKSGSLPSISDLDETEDSDEEE